MMMVVVIGLWRWFEVGKALFGMLVQDKDRG